MVQRDDEYSQEEKSRAPQGADNKIISGQNLSAYLLGGAIFLVMVPLGMLRILAATGIWNPLHLKSRFWSGVLMVLAPLLLLLVSILPLHYRQKVPESVVGLLTLAVWLALLITLFSGR